MVPLQKELTGHLWFMMEIFTKRMVPAIGARRVKMAGNRLTNQAR